MFALKIIQNYIVWYKRDSLSKKLGGRINLSLSSSVRDFFGLFFIFAVFGNRRTFNFTSTCSTNGE